MNRLAALLVLVPLALSCTSDPRGRVGGHKERARGLLERGQAREAVLEARSAVQLAPGDTDARLLLGDALQQSGDLREAHRVFRRLADEDPGNTRAQLRLGRLYLLSNDLPRVRAAAGSVLDAEPRNTEAHALLGQAAAREGDVDGALKHFDEAIAGAPGDSEHWAAKVALLLGAGRLPEARAAAEALLTRSPDDPKGLLLLAQTAHLQGDAAAVDRTFARLLETRSEDPLAWIEYGNFWQTAGEGDKALAAYRKAAGLDAKGTGAWERMADLLLERREPAAAREAVAAIRSRNPKSLAAQYYGALAALQEGRLQEAVAGLQLVVGEAPNHKEARYYLAMGHFLQGNHRTAQIEVTRAVELDPGFYKARMLLAQILLSSRDFAGALAATDGLVQPPGIHTEALMIRGSALLGLGRPAQSRELFQKLTELVPANSRAHERLGTSWLAEGKPEAALRSWRRALELDPADIRPLSLSTQVLVAQKRPSEAVTLVEEHLARGHDGAGIRELLGWAYAAKGDRARAREELERAVSMEPNAVGAYSLLARLHEGPDAARRALKDLEEALAVRPDYLRGWIEKAMLLERLGDAAGAEKAHRRVLALKSDFVPSLNNLASALAERGGDLNEALRFAERAVELAPDSPVTNDTLGWIYVKKGVYGKALAHLGPAGESLASVPEVHYHLAKAYAGLGETARALASARKALSLSEEFPGSDDARSLVLELERAEKPAAR